MDDTDSAPLRRAWWRRWNWWKVGFFVLLVLFEGAREIAVLEANAPAEVATLASVVGTDGYVVANGRWNRIDGGSQLAPTSVRIECRKEEARCYEVSYNINGQYAGSPELAMFPATWGIDQVSYENDDAACARYSVRIDQKIEKVFALRERKDNPSMAGFDCSKLERRVEMTLTNGYEPHDDVWKGHFVPILSTLVAVFGQ